MTTPTRRQLVLGGAAMTLASGSAGATRDNAAAAVATSVTAATHKDARRPANPLYAAGVSPAPGLWRHRRYVPCRYGQVHLTSTGPAPGTSGETAAVAKPPVVCLPMSPRSGRDFDELALTLGADRWVHAPDVPGFGGSDAPPSRVAIDDYAQALIEALRAAGLGGRATPAADFIGQHTGAAITTEIARRAPDLVRRIVFIGVPLFGDAEREQLRAQFVKPRPYFEDPQFLAQTWQRDLPAIAGGLSQERMLMRFAEIMRAGAGSWWGFDAVFRYPTRERLPGVTQPVLSIILDERLGPASREAATLVQRGEILELTELPGSALDGASARLAGEARRFFDRT